MKCDEIFAALAMLEKERGIPQSFMMGKIIQALTTAYKRDHEGVEYVVVDVDEEKKDLKMYVQKEIVEEVENPASQISLEEAKRISAKNELGGMVNFPVESVEFGRIDPRNGNVILRIGSGSEATEAVLTMNEQVPGEELHEGQMVKVYLVEVRRSTRGPQVMISRTHPGLVKRLFELEVPEIYDGPVEVRSIAREAGNRTKIAVWSEDPNVDAIGACVGPRGQRVNAIVDELRGEKIDIVKYSEDPAEFIAAALAPADVVSVQLADEGKACRVTVPADQLSLAIGKEGQNARLAARLTGYKIDIKAANAE